MCLMLRLLDKGAPGSNYVTVHFSSLFRRKANLLWTNLGRRTKEANLTNQDAGTPSEALQRRAEHQYTARAPLNVYPAFGCRHESGTQKHGRDSLVTIDFKQLSPHLKSKIIKYYHSEICRYATESWSQLQHSNPMKNECFISLSLLLKSSPIEFVQPPTPLKLSFPERRQCPAVWLVHIHHN